MYWTFQFHFIQHVVVWPLNLRKRLIYAESVLVYKNPLAITIKDWREDLWWVGRINEFHVSVYRRKTYDSVPRDENWGGVYNWSVANDAKTWQLLNWKSNTVVGRLWAFLDIPFLPAPRLLRYFFFQFLNYGVQFMLFSKSEQHRKHWHHHHTFCPCVAFMADMIEIGLGENAHIA